MGFWTRVTCSGDSSLYSHYILKQTKDECISFRLGIPNKLDINKDKILLRFLVVNIVIGYRVFVEFSSNFNRLVFSRPKYLEDPRLDKGREFRNLGICRSNSQIHIYIPIHISELEWLSAGNHNAPFIQSYLISLKTGIFPVKDTVKAEKVESELSFP